MSKKTQTNSRNIMVKGKKASIKDKNSNNNNDKEVQVIKKENVTTDDNNNNDDDDEYGCLDLHTPMNILNNNDPSCTLLVQIDPDNSSMLNFHGISGAMGRFEADNNGSKLILSCVCIW